MLETTTKKTKLDIKIVQLSKLMGGAFPKANTCYVITRSLLGTHVMWEPIENLAFWYHEGMQPILAALETDLSQTQKCLEELRHFQEKDYLGR
jgi:hypothetical protein